MSRALWNTIPGWPGRLRHAGLCEAREEPFETPLPKLFVDRCSTFFLQDCVAVNPQDVVDTNSLPSRTVL